MMSCRSDIEHLQELVLRLAPADAEPMNRLERTRFVLEFMLAGIHRPAGARRYRVGLAERIDSGGPPSRSRR
jgi:hypothetical protein